MKNMHNVQLLFSIKVYVFCSASAVAQKTNVCKCTAADLHQGYSSIPKCTAAPQAQMSESGWPNISRGHH